MGAVRDATISAFNEFIMTQRGVNGTAEVWLQRFNTAIQADGFKPERWDDLAAVPLLTHETYQPRENTPLYDAIGWMLHFAGNNFAQRPEHERPEKVVMVIQTDGEENSSREYTARQVFDSITMQRERYGWQFTFLGADQDAWMVSGTLGIARASTMSYSSTPQGTSDVMTMASSSVAAYRAGTKSSVDYADTDIRTDKKRKPKPGQ